MKRFLLVTLIIPSILLALGVAAFLGVGYFLSPQDPLAKVDAIVAVSGGDTNARTTEAVRLYRDGWAPSIIFSGAALDPTSPSNARVMANAAIAAGVPAHAILLDETSQNTHQNAADVAALIREHNYQSIILVTSPYHQRRVNLAFHNQLGANFPIINHSSVDQDWRRSHWWATPTSRNLTLQELQKTAYEYLTGKSNQ